MSKSKAWDTFLQDPFSFADNIKLTIKGNNLNIFQKYRKIRNTALGIAIFMLILWIICGFDSNILQFMHVLLEGVPSFLMGKLSFNDLHILYDSFYGKEMHYSAFVIYGLMYWYLSKHFDKLGIQKSKNICYAAGLMFLAVASFEFYWIYSYSIFQQQSWVSTWIMPQLRILLQNVAFISAGAICVLYMWTDNYIYEGKIAIARRWRFNWNWISILLIASTIFLAALWIYYPFQSQQIQVQLSNGQIWKSSPYFPQTLYTVDVDPTDSVNAGVWFYVPNDLIHLWNTIVKVMWTLTILYIGLFQEIKGWEKIVEKSAS